MMKSSWTANGQDVCGQQGSVVQQVPQGGLGNVRKHGGSGVVHLGLWMKLCPLLIWRTLPENTHRQVVKSCPPVAQSMWLVITTCTCRFGTFQSRLEESSFDN